MAKRLNIIPNVRAAYEELYRRRTEVMKKTWFVLVLVLTYRTAANVLFQRLISVQLGHSWDSDFVRQAEFWLVVCGENFLHAVMAVAMLRLFYGFDIPDTWSTKIRKGDVYEDRIVLSLPIYFSFGWRELAYTIFDSVLYGFILLISGAAVLIFVHVHDVQPQGILDLFQTYKTQALIKGWTKEIAGRVFDAVLFLVCPYIALAQDFEFTKIKTLVVAINGNILRTAIISFFIMAPYYIVKHIEFFVFPFIKNDEAKHLEWVAYSNLHSIVFYICLFAWTAFAANAYRELKPADIKDDQKQYIAGDGRSYA